MATNVLGTVYETLLCSPGMSEAVRIDVKLNRKAILLLNSIIEGVVGNGTEKSLELIQLVPKDDLIELSSFIDECLKKAGLKDLSEKMKSL